MSKELNRKNNKDNFSWRYVVNLWMVLLFITIILDFIAENAFSNIVGPLAAIYTATLAIYSAEKEFERWQDYYDGRHPGEVYVILWTVLIIGILVTDVILGKLYKMEPEIIATYIVVLGILAVTRKSKSFFTRRKGLR